MGQVQGEGEEEEGRRGAVSIDRAVAHRFRVPLTHGVSVTIQPWLRAKSSDGVMACHRSIC